MNRIGTLFFLSAATCLVAGCGKPGTGGGVDGPPPLSPEEAARYRQVKIDVTGAT